MRYWDQEGREEVTLWEHREGCLEEVVQSLWGLRVTKEGLPGGEFLTRAFGEGADSGEAEKGKGI